jgi:HK97 gp10 family phage protein
MADTVTFEVKGLQQLGENMRGLSEAVNKRLAAAATGAAAKVVKEAAKQNVRNSPSVDTGSLLESIISKKIPNSQSGLTSAHIVTPRHHRTRRKTKTKQSVAPHAVFVQFGTVNMPAEPFLDVALSRNIGRATDAMKQKLASGIAREVAKVGK